MSVRSSSRANRGKNPWRGNPEVIEVRNESSISTASPTQSSTAALIPLGDVTQQQWAALPNTLIELTGMPMGRHPMTGKLVVPNPPSINAEEQREPSEPASDDDENLSEASSDNMISLPENPPDTPAYTVQATLKMEGIKKDWCQLHVVGYNHTFPLLTVSRAVHQQAFQQARSIQQTSCVLIDLEAEVLYTGQAKVHALRNTLETLSPSSWDPVMASIFVLHEQAQTRQIRVNLIYFYRPKPLEVTDCMPDTVPTIKRGGEGVLLPGESPAKKKGKSSTIDQYMAARANSSTARGLLAADTRQLQFEHEGKDHVREILKLYRCQLSKCDNPSKLCIQKGGRHFMLNRELPKLWSDAVIEGDATVLSIPVNLLHLVTIEEPGEFRRRGRQGEFNPSTPVAPAPQIIMIPPQQYFPAPTAPGRQSSPPAPEDPGDLHNYIAWFKVREPSLQDTIEEVVAVLDQERDSLTTLESMSEARIARHELPAGLMARMKASVKTWRRAAS